MTRAVLDTNVLASGFTIRGGASDLLLRSWLADAWELVISDHILTELERTLQKPYFRRRLTPERIAANLSLLRRRAHRVPITARVRAIASHPEDDLILGTAISGRAGYLVTGDKKLQDVAAYRGVTILSPRAFLDTVAPSG